MSRKTAEDDGRDSGAGESGWVYIAGRPRRRHITTTSAMPSPVLSTLLLFVGAVAAQDGGLLADCPEDLAVCLKARLVGSLDRVARLQRLEIAPGLAVLRDPASSPPPAPTSEAALLDSLASSRSDDKEAALDSMIADKVASIFDGRYLRIDLTQPTEEGKLVNA